MFDANTYVVAGAFAAVAVAAYLVHRQHKTCEHLKERANHYKNKSINMEARNTVLQSVLNAKEDICGLLNDRIDRALERATKHPNTRPDKIVEILMGTDKEPVPATLFQKLTRSTTSQTGEEK